MPSLRTRLAHLWAADAALTATSLVVTAALVPFVAGIWLDPRLVSGAPVWLKPAKFAASIAIYTLTLAGIFTLLPDWARVRRFVSRVTVGVMAIEMSVITVQAARGVTSHFNTATLLDGTLFTIMGAAILAQTFTSIAVAVALWRQHFSDRALGWALRLGFTITIAGALSGGLMTRPTDDQLARARQHGQMPVAGAHTVGAPDGGAGLPGTGWSRDHGDLRVPHFLGLHAVQVLPLLAFAVARLGRSEDTRARLVVAAAASYASLFVLLTWQALRGQALLRPDAATVAVVSIWFAASFAAVWLTLPGRTRRAAVYVRHAQDV